MATPPQLLYVVNGIPHVPAPGGPTRAFHLVRAAADVGAVTLVTVEGDATAEAAAIAGSCDRIVTAPAPPPAAYAPRAQSDRHRGTNGGASSVLWRFDPRPLQTTVGNLLRTNPFDLVVVEHTELAAALAPLLRKWDGPALADLHNVLSVHQMRVAQLQGADGGEERKALGLADRHAVRRIQAIERDILRTYTRVTAVSDVDACHLRRLVADAPVRVVPNGVDAAYFSFSFGAIRCQDEPPPERLVFTGALWYQPNVDGLRYFLAEIWPTVRTKRPRTRFCIVGARPGADVRALAEQPGVEIHASVADVRPFLAASTAAVVPLRLGSGTRLKILEALAAGRPVVSTTVGAEGLALEPGHDILLADDPAHFAEAVVRLLAQPAYARSLANRGRETVRRRYDWSVVAAHFRDVLAEALRTGRGACTRTTTG